MVQGAEQVTASNNQVSFGDLNRLNGLYRDIDTPSYRCTTGQGAEAASRAISPI
ncbi:MAG: hypothetical protein RLO50_06240 [Azospirillaceae bacterium]